MAFLGRARYERTLGARGSRNGNRPRQVQTAEGELEIQVPQIRGAAERFVSSVIPNGRTALRTRPLEALIIGRVAMFGKARNRMKVPTERARSVRQRCRRVCVLNWGTPARTAYGSHHLRPRPQMMGSARLRRPSERSSGPRACERSRRWTM